MKHENGPQYDKDDTFKTKARLHQSKYRSEVLKVGFDEYGNRLQDDDASRWVNYYEGLNVRAEKKARFRGYSKSRDADMLRSEHIPFNMLAPLKCHPPLAQQVLKRAFGIECGPPEAFRFEWAPPRREQYLDDATSFDAYVQARDQAGRRIGVGIEVKYTENGYRLGKREGERINQKNSLYRVVARKSGQFLDPEGEELADDDIRQIWRNHLLGLAMRQRGDIDDFVSVILYPNGNDHFNMAIPKYARLLRAEHKSAVRGCTFEEFIDSISGDEEIMNWRTYLAKRYLIGG